MGSSMNTQTERTLALLQTRAMILTRVKGHLLGMWTPAKKKYGVGAMRTLCLHCGMGLMILPRMPYKRGELPAIQGEVLFDRCTVHKG